MYIPKCGQLHYLDHSYTLATVTLPRYCQLQEAGTSCCQDCVGGKKSHTTCTCIVCLHDYTTGMHTDVSMHTHHCGKPHNKGRSHSPAGPHMATQVYRQELGYPQHLTIIANWTIGWSGHLFGQIGLVMQTHLLHGHRVTCLPLP